jgi:hypothetical protein
LKLHLYQF